jgi:hypothetical protein
MHASSTTLSAQAAATREEATAWAIRAATRVASMGASVQKFNGNKKFEGKRIHRILQNSEKFDEIWENSTEMHLMSERNRNLLKTRKSAEFAELSADNSAE